ncbi:MAG: TonB-dependent receptor [Pseudomonadota bacterium]
MIIGKRTYQIGVAAVALAAPVSVWAQATPPSTQMTAPDMAQPSPDVNSADDIIVTAQKRDQRLLDVPVAITAISAETLTTQGMNRIQDFYDRVPGLQYSGQRVSALSLRGVTSGGQTSATVALLVDDVQFGGTTNAGQPPIPDFDASAIERVEVLRGPQGTLYGASSLGGLIKYVLKQPSTQDFSGRIEVGGTTVANGGEGYAVRGSVNVPVTNWLAVSGSGFKREDAPYLDNALTNKKDVNTRDAWGYRGAILLQPTDNFKIVGSMLKQKQDALNSDLAITSGGVPICVACTTGGTAATRATAPTTFEPVYGDLTIRALDSTNTSTYQLYSARGELKLGGATITSVSAWGLADNVITSDVSAVFSFLPPIYGAPAGSTVQIANADRTTKFSQELRANGSIGRFDWLVGGFYTVEHATTNQTLLLSNPSGTLLATPYISSGPSRYREVAGFADLTWRATDKFEIQIGGRYAGNKQSFDTGTLIDGPAQVAFGPSGREVKGSSDNAFTWLISPTYHFTRDIMAYVRVANGYRPGGPNLDSTGVGNYGPDRVINYELGFKGRVVPGLLTIDTSLFQIDWSDIQLQGTAPNQFTFVTNGGKARSRGLEFAATLTPRRGLSVDANVAFTDATLTETLPLVNSSSLRGQAGDRLPFTANIAGSVTVLQKFDLSERLGASLGVNYTYVGERPGGFNTLNGTRPRILIPGYDTLNLTAGLTFDRNWQATLFLRNAFDKRGISAAQNRNGNNVPTALFIQPRTLGVTLARTF